LLRTGPLIHLHLHARFLARASSGAIGGDRSKQQPLPSRLAFLQSLQKAVEKIQAPPAARQSEWIGYRETRTHYSAAALASKAELVEAMLRRLRPRLVYDLGANTGEYSALAARLGSRCVAFDSDAACVGSMYRREKELAGWLLPLVMDLANPSPALGFANEERMSLVERGHSDLTLALGLVHHLRITANIPFQLLGRFLARISSDLLIEFVPPDDPMAERMLHGRPPFEDYSLEGFVEAVSPWFELASSMPVRDSVRTLLHFERAL
jgi:ribosomal protein L11 methylase PrmA